MGSRAATCRKRGGGAKDITNVTQDFIAGFGTAPPSKDNLLKREKKKTISTGCVKKRSGEPETLHSAINLYPIAESVVRSPMKQENVSLSCKCRDQRCVRT